jgi:hypothetical protein
MEFCSACTEGTLVPKVGINTFEYKEGEYGVAYHFSECSACGALIADAQQTRLNKRLIRALKEEIDSNIGVIGIAPEYVIIDDLDVDYEVDFEIKEMDSEAAGMAGDWS